MASSEGFRRTLTPAMAGAFVAVCAVLLAAALRLDPRLALAARAFGAALLVAAGGFVAEALLGEARRRAARPAVPVRQDPAPATFRARLAHYGRRAVRLPFALDWFGSWLPVLATLACSAGAIAISLKLWSASDTTALAASTQQAIGAVFIVAAFPLLLLDRVYAHRHDDASASVLERLLRVPLLAAMALGLALIARSLGLEWPRLIDRAVLVVIMLVAAEIGLRCVAGFFLPGLPLAERRPVDSLAAGLIALRRPSLGATNETVERLIGIDLSRSWALAFMRRAALPVLAGMALFAWLLTGVTALGLDQRAVYEQFGRPIEALGPGLHIHLPWPFGIMRGVELGVVHEIPIVFPADQNGGATERVAEDRSAAEAQAPEAADRLWDASHPSEASYLVASHANGRESFQIVNIDLRIVYRTGLNDASAFAAAYRIADPENLIRAESGRMLVRYFARYTLLDVLGQNRAAFVASFRNELQARLDALQTGVDIIAVIVEAIHPPPDAASAYHNVQAAQIDSITRISRSKGEAVQTLQSAELDAAKTRNVATADAAEQVSQAQTAKTLFDGDRQAYATGGHAFLLERWLAHLSKALALAPLVIVDHRLSGPNAPTLDLRKPGGASTPAPATNQE